MKEIGGYFELELPAKEEFHKNALRFNTGRSCIEYILLNKKYKKVWVPYFTCDVILEPIKKLNINYEFYSIDKKLYPTVDFSKISNDEVFIYTNYFGVCDENVSQISEEKINLIIDNSQAFFSKPLINTDTFYSPRKFFGVPDGAYLYSDINNIENLELDESFGRCNHLLERIDLSASEGYSDYKNNDNSLSDQPVKIMSRLTHRILSSIDYGKIKQIRIENFNFFHNIFKNTNEIEIKFSGNETAMIYPLLIKNNDLKKKLINNKIYIATYWPNVKDWVENNSIEYYLFENLLALPVDQRLNLQDLEFISKVING